MNMGHCGGLEVWDAYHITSALDFNLAADLCGLININRSNKTKGNNKLKDFVSSC